MVKEFSHVINGGSPQIGREGNDVTIISEAGGVPNV